MRLGVGGARFVVDERHLAEEIAAIEDRQRFFAHARNEFRDAHAAIEDDEELVPLLAFAKDHRSFAKFFLGREGRQQLHFRRRQPALFEEIDLVLRLDDDLLGLALSFRAFAPGAFLGVLLEEELQLLVGVADFLAERAPECPVQTDRQLFLLIHELIERAEREGVAGRGLDRDGIAGAMGAIDEVHLAEDGVVIERAENLRTEGRVLADLDATAPDHVKIHGAIFFPKDVRALLQLFHAREFREPRDLLVLHVLKNGQLAQIDLHGRNAAALLGIARDLVDDLLQILARLELEEILFAKLEALGADAQILDARVDQAVELVVVEILHPLQGIDHAADRLGAFAFLVGREKKRVDELIERDVEILQLELDAARNLRQSAIEWI